MSNYILALQIETFYSLYRFGKIAIDRSSLIPVLGRLEDGRPKVDVRQFIERFPQFVDDDFYVILECALDPAVPTDLKISGDVKELYLSVKKVSDNAPQTFLKIEDVINIFPLTDRASIILKGRLKEEINLGKPIFQDLIATAQQESDKLEITSGALALSTLCGLEDADKSQRFDSVIFNAIRFRKEGGRAPDTDNLLFQSLVYDRHEPFPVNDLGLLYDLNKIMCDIYKVNHTAANFYKYLEKLEKKEKDFSLYELIKLFEESEECMGIRGKIIEMSEEGKDYVSILLFLKYRDEFRRIDKKKGKLAKMELLYDMAELKSEYSMESRNGVYLLGGFFSFKYFIDDYYAHRKLRILRTPVEIPAEKPDKQVLVRRKGINVTEEPNVEKSQVASTEEVKDEKTTSSEFVESIGKTAQVEDEEAVETDESLSKEEQADGQDVVEAADTSTEEGHVKNTEGDAVVEKQVVEQADIEGELNVAEERPLKQLQVKAEKQNRKVKKL